MAEKKQTELKAFLEVINKKDKRHHGKKIEFSFVNRKRRNRK